MELSNEILPSEVVSKIRVYHSHPVVDAARKFFGSAMKPRYWLSEYQIAKTRYSRLYNKKLYLDDLCYQSWKYDDETSDFGYYREMDDEEFEMFIDQIVK